jgi:hypothetical protein
VLDDLAAGGRVAVAEPLGEVVGDPFGGDQQHPLGPEPGQLLAEPVQRADPEHHPPVSAS